MRSCLHGVSPGVSPPVPLFTTFYLSLPNESRWKWHGGNGVFKCTLLYRNVLWLQVMKNVDFHWNPSIQWSLEVFKCGVEEKGLRLGQHSPAEIVKINLLVGLSMDIAIQGERILVNLCLDLLFIMFGVTLLNNPIYHRLICKAKNKKKVIRTH